MAEQSGICVIVPRSQQGYWPRVFGMGILVSDDEVVTCAHVVNAACGRDWHVRPDGGTLEVCFPFAGPACVVGKVDLARWHPRRLGESQSAGALEDIVVITLSKPAPKKVDRAQLKPHVSDHAVKTYGFRAKQAQDGSWHSHPYGEWVPCQILGPQPGGRVLIGGLRVQGGSVQKGFSGAGVYDPELDAVVGMIVEADRDKTLQLAQFIDEPSLRLALGWHAHQRPLTVPRAAVGAAHGDQPFQAPPLPAHHIERTLAVRALSDALFSDARPEAGVLVIAAIHGLPGVGKTSLASSIAHDPATIERFKDGVL